MRCVCVWTLFGVELWKKINQETGLAGRRHRCVRRGRGRRGSESTVEGFLRSGWGVLLKLGEGVVSSVRHGTEQDTSVTTK